MYHERNVYLGTSDAQPLVIKTSDVEAMRVDSDGEVGVGTASPAGPLHVAGSSAPQALVVLPNGDIGMGIDAPYEAHVQIITQDPTSGSISSLKIGGYDIPSSTPYDAKLQLRTSAGGTATLRFNDRFQGTSVNFVKYPDIGFGNWFKVENDHDNLPGLTTVFQIYNSGSGTDADDRMAVMVPLGVGTADPAEALDVSGNLHVSGNMTVDGSKSAVVDTEDYGRRTLYAVESPEVWFEDFGTAELVDGEARVAFEPVFAQTVDLVAGYHVFLTPLGDCALYVAEKADAGFTVRALNGRTCSMAFDYRIVARRLGYDDVRLEPAGSRALDVRQASGTQRGDEP